MERPRIKHLSTGKKLYYNGKEFLAKSTPSEPTSNMEEYEVYELLNTYFSVEESEEGYHHDVGVYIEISDKDTVYKNYKVFTNKGIIHIQYSVGTWGTLYGKYDEKTETIIRGPLHTALAYGTDHK